MKNKTKIIWCCRGTNTLLGSLSHLFGASSSTSSYTSSSTWHGWLLKTDENLMTEMTQLKESMGFQKLMGLKTGRTTRLENWIW